jgi:hypothetical protein
MEWRLFQNGKISKSGVTFHKSGKWIKITAIFGDCVDMEHFELSWRSNSGEPDWDVGLSLMDLKVILVYRWPLMHFDWWCGLMRH